jgi:hypothetical protein
MVFSPKSEKEFHRNSPFDRMMEWFFEGPDLVNDRPKGRPRRGGAKRRH